MSEPLPLLPSLIDTSAFCKNNKYSYRTALRLQDVSSWLSRMRLDLLPEELTAPLLSNPLRNGLLLAGIAAAVTQQPLHGICQPVTTLAAARSNLMVAAAALGLVSPAFAAAAAAAAARRDQADAHTAAQDPGGLRQGCAGQGLSPDARPGFKGSVGSSSPVRGRCHSSSRSPVRGGPRSLSGSPTRGYPGSRTADSCSGMALDGSNSCWCFAAVATGPGGLHSSMVGAWGHGSHDGRGTEPAAPVLCDPASSCCCGCWACQQLSGTVLEHAVLQLLEFVLVGDTSCMWGLLYALQQAFPVMLGMDVHNPRAKSPAHAADARVAGRARQAPSGDTVQQQQQQGPSSGASTGTGQSVKPQQHSVKAPGLGTAAGAVKASGTKLGSGVPRGTHSSSGGSSGSSSGCVVVQPLQGPNWRSFLLPYTAGELQE
jgi:hypothetical protein